MLRASLGGAWLIVVLVGCILPERQAMNPLPENAPPLAYAEMLVRARNQAGAALDAFYEDSWLGLEQAADRLQQTARLLPKATDIPEFLKTKIGAEAELLRQDSAKLADAARAKNAPQANEAMQRINQRIRLLRSTEAIDKLREE